MSCARSSGGAGAGDPSSGLGSLSSTCSSSTYSLEGDLGEASKISDDRTKNSIGGLGAIIGGIFGSSRKIFKTGG